MSENSKKRKTLTTAIAVILAIVTVIGSTTYAYLQGNTDHVINAFAANQVSVELKESTGGKYNIIPGTSEAKDPTVTVNTTVPAYVYVEVTDNTENLVTYAIADGWQKLEGFENVYYREADGSSAEEKYVVLQNNMVSYDESIVNSDMLVQNDDGTYSLKEGITLSFNALAIQKEPFNDAKSAYAALKNEWCDVTAKLSAINERNIGLNGQYMPRKDATTFAIKVKEGEKYRISGWTQGSQALYCLRNGVESTNSPVIAKYPEAVDYAYVQHNDIEVTIPAGVSYMEMSTVNNHLSDFKLEKIGSAAVENAETKLLHYDENKYIVMCFDDTLSDISDVVELFDKYNVPANFATIPEYLNRTTNTGETAKEVLLKAQANGHEILAHNDATGLLTSESSDEDYINVMSNTKKALEENGFIINGYLNPGGTKNGIHSDTQDWSKTFAACKAAGYLYSDMSGRPNKYIEPYTMGRFYFGTTDIETFKTEINNWWKWGYHYKVFINHQVDNLDFIEQVIQYCLDNDVQIVTYNSLYNAYMN